MNTLLARVAARRSVFPVACVLVGLWACGGTDQGNDGGGAASGGASGSSSGGGGVGGGEPTGINYAPAESLAQGIRYPRRVVLNGGAAYVAQYQANAGVAKVSVDGGGVETFTTIRTTSVAGGDGEVFVGGDEGGFGAVAKLEGTVVTATWQGPDFDAVLDLAISDTYLAVATFAGGVEFRQLSTLNKAGPIASLPGTARIAFGAGRLLATNQNNGRVYAIQLPAGTTSVLMDGKGSEHPSAILEAGDRLYVGEWSPGTELFETNLDGTGKKVIAAGCRDVVNVVAFGGELYWAERGACFQNGTRGRLRRRRLDGQVETMSDNVECMGSVAVNESGIYWTSHSSGAPTDGQLWRMKRLLP